MKLNGKFVDDADYHKVTLVTSQAYQDGFTALYALKCSPWKTVKESLKKLFKPILVLEKNEKRGDYQHAV